MRTVLTPYQRRIAVALLVDGVPIDVLAQRLGTSRGALYKTVHDARVRLRGELTAKGCYLPSTATRSPDPHPSSTPAGTR
jgi:RNA polymerase sigma-70 factor (ECF subfamily)